jgi:hypothetical protein
MENLIQIVCCILMLISTVSFLFLLFKNELLVYLIAFCLKNPPHRLLRITVSGTFVKRIPTAAATTNAAVIRTVRGTFGGKRSKCANKF